MRRAAILLCSDLALLLALVGCEKHHPDQSAPDPPAKGDQLASIVGRWEALANKEKVSLEFTKTGTLHLAGNLHYLRDLLQCAMILDEFGARPGTAAITYKPLEGNKLEVESDWSKLLKALSSTGDGPWDAQGKVREVLKVAVNETELTITSEREKSMTFKRGKPGGG
jgi:hypothetical protein